MEKKNAEAVRDFRARFSGSRAKGERFHYDFAKDVDGLKKLGLARDLEAKADKADKA